VSLKTEIEWSKCGETKVSHASRLLLVIFNLKGKTMCDMEKADRNGY